MSIAEVSSLPTAPPVVDVARASKQVLVVEDDQEIALTLKECLEGEGYVVHTAHDGGAALALLAASTSLPSLIVLDLMMPGMDGYEFCERRLLDPRLTAIPVLITSAAESNKTRSTEGWCENVSMLRKPFDLEVLLQTVARLAQQGP
jgi:CheY-like chemotaxis protein